MNPVLLVQTYPPSPISRFPCTLNWQLCQPETSLDAASRLHFTLAGPLCCRRPLTGLCRLGLKVEAGMPGSWTWEIIKTLSTSAVLPGVGKLTPLFSFAPESDFSEFV